MDQQIQEKSKKIFYILTGFVFLCGILAAAGAGAILANQEALHWKGWGGEVSQNSDGDDVSLPRELADFLFLLVGLSIIFVKAQKLGGSQRIVRFLRYCCFLAGLLGGSVFKPQLIQKKLGVSLGSPNQPFVGFP